MLQANRITPIVYILPFLICTLIYLPGLKGGFFLDDYPNIINNPAIQIDSLTATNLKQAALLSSSSTFQRNVSMLSFAFSHYLSGGLYAYGFKLFNLAIHLLNGFLLLVLLKLISRGISTENRTPQINHWIIIAIVLSWLISPLNVSTVLYVVQRMAMLSAFFVLSGLIFYIRFRISFNNKHNHQSILEFSLFIACTILAVLSKENGILLPYYALLIEIAFFQFSTSSNKQRTWFISLAGIFVGLSLIVLSGILLFSPESVLSGYESRSFTLPERLLTESRVVWWYIQSLIFPINTYLGLFHDDFVLSTSIFDPVITLFSVIGFFILLITGILTLRKSPVFGFGILFFFLGHSLESTIIPLEILFEHRNYLPGIGILIALYFGIESVLKKSKVKYANMTVLLLYFVFLTTSTVARVNSWKDNLSLATTQVINHPQSARAHTMLGTELMKLAKYTINPTGKDQLQAKCKNHFITATKIDPEATSAYFAIIHHAYKTDHYIDKEQIKLLETVLKSGRHDASAINHLSQLVNREMLSNTGLPKEVIMRLLHALDQNPNLPERSRAELYTLISKYLLKVTSDHDYAIYYIAKAAETMPKNPRYRMHLAMALSHLGRKKEACEELKTVISIDSLSRESERVNALQNHLNTCIKTG
jgi:tetratricopeptide (TPR) repeat protein